MADTAAGSQTTASKETTQPVTGPDYGFDTVAQRRGTYSMKWSEAYHRAFPLPHTRFDEDTIPMMVADMDFLCSPAIRAAMHRVADFGIYGYTCHLAEPAYKEAIISWYRRRYDTAVKPEEILYSNGSVEAVNHAVRTFSAVGDGVIICRPVYGHFNSMVEQDCYRKAVNCELLNDGTGYYTMDWADFEAKCAVPTNRVFVLSSPANPVGRVWTRDELARMAAICNQHHVVLVSDEVHSDILRKGVRHTTILNATRDYSNIVMITAINKGFNVAGLQCANVIIPDESLRGRFEKDFGERLCTPFAVGALLAAYNESEDWLTAMNAYVDDNIDFAIGFLREHMPKVRVWRPEGTYMLWLDFGAYGLPEEAIHRKIYMEANVMLQDGTVHAVETGGQFQRMCVTCAKSVLQTALTRIAGAFADCA